MNSSNASPHQQTTPDGQPTKADYLEPKLASGNGFVASGFVALVSSKDQVATVTRQRALFRASTGLHPGVILESCDFRVAVAHNQSSYFASDANSGVSVLLHGDLYWDEVIAGDNPAQALLRCALETDAMGLARKLDGSCAVLLVTQEAVTVIIDRVSSRKVFFSRNCDGFWLSSLLYLQPQSEVDPAAVVSQIINRCQYAERTLLKGVRTLGQGQLHRLHRDGLVSTKYWTYGFEQADARRFKARLVDKKKELEQLLSLAVRKRLPTNGSALCSLSGGIDSRAIFGLLLQQRAAEGNLQALSYGSEQDDDPIVARELCDLFGVSHRLISFGGDLANVIQLNANHCEGLVFFYPQGLDKFVQAASSFNPADVMFVGDECFGWNDMDLSTIDDVLIKGVGIRAPVVVPDYYSYGRYPGNEIAATLQTGVDSLIERCAPFDNLHDCKDFLYLEQRLPHMLMPWREYHSGRYVSIANPLIDNQILDFMKTVPTEYRIDKRLFRDTVTNLFPELFAVRTARPGGTDNHMLDQLFVRQYTTLEALVTGSDSRLDDIIPPDVILIGLVDLVQRLTTAGWPIPDSIRRILDRGRRKLLASRFYRARMRKHNSVRHGLMSIHPMQMATLLQLRIYLS